VVRVFDFREWWRKEYRSPEQMEIMGHINFSPISGHTHLFAANVSEEDEIMLKLLGIFRDHSVSTSITDDPTLNGNVKMLIEFDNKFHIIEIHRQKSSPIK